MTELPDCEHEFSFGLCLRCRIEEDDPSLNEAVVALPKPKDVIASAIRLGIISSGDLRG